MNHWLKICALEDIPQLGSRVVQRGGQSDIAIFRTSEDTVFALEDRCPHRGARLSLGWNLGDRVACWYHGIEVDGGGTVKQVPASANCPLEGKACVKSYPVEEHAGAVFLWFGIDPAAPPATRRCTRRRTARAARGASCPGSTWLLTRRAALS
jgi:phenylpropionate dioxygenase-like ring-hydroxylating dioxygenase large terminal subunit